MFNFFKNKKKHRIIGDYRRSTDKDKNTCLKFLIENSRLICKYHSFDTFKELALNYRILYDRTNRTKIINDYKKYILTKSNNHKSNLAISYNMINTIVVDEELEKQIIEFMYEQIKDHDLQTFKNQKYFLKRHMIMNYVRDKIVSKTPQ